MTVFEVLLGHTLAAGAAGVAAQLYIAAFLLSTESIDSPRPFTRWLYRYLVFSFWYLASFLLSPALAAPLLKQPAITAVVRDNTLLFFAIPVPLAALLYLADRWFKIRVNGAKIRARKQLRAGR